MTRNVDMSRTPNDLPFVMRVVDLLAEGGLSAWLFGGWAEELRGLVPPCSHRDVDLLYPAPNFERLDDFFLAERLDEVGEDRSYARAFSLDGITVELLLVSRDADGWFTDFRSGRLRWPADVFGRAARPPVASESALVSYRNAYVSLHARRAA
jgi:hypothetical protein